MVFPDSADALSLLRPPPLRLAVALLALTLLAWGGVIGGSFQYDDRASALVQGGAGLRIRPLLALTWTWDRTVHGDDPAGWLAEGFLFHALTVLVVFALARRILSPLGAFLGAAAFALQPAHAEVVAYVSGRSTGLMALLLLLGLWIWRPGSPRRTVGAGVFFIGAVAVKEVALVFPVLLVLWSLASERRVPSARTWAGFGALAAALAAALWAGVPRYRALATWSLAERGPWQSLALNVAVLPEQLSLWVRPWALSVEHTVDMGRGSGGWVLLALLVGAAWACRRRAPGVTLCIAWVLVALAPTQSVVAKADVLTEKPLYLAWVAPAMLLGGVLAWALERQRGSRGIRHLVGPSGLAGGARGARGIKHLVFPPGSRGIRHLVGRAGLVAAVVALASLATVEVRRRVEVWRTPRSLWADAVRKAPRSSRAWNNLATSLRSSSMEDALVAARRSVELDPANGFALSNLSNLEVLCPDGCTR